MIISLLLLLFTFNNVTGQVLGVDDYFVRAISFNAKTFFPCSRTDRVGGLPTTYLKKGTLSGQIIFSLKDLQGEYIRYKEDGINFSVCDPGTDVEGGGKCRCQYVELTQVTGPYDESFGFTISNPNNDTEGEIELIINKEGINFTIKLLWYRIIESKPIKVN
ncbi:hypothetical protein [Flammeovirga pacifica]|nr:hypothetical protein [Flammeovirga pacifica]